MRRRPSCAALTPMTPMNALPNDSAIDDGEETEQDMPQTVGERITELSRRLSVDVEAAAGPVALYASKSRTGSTSSRHGGRPAVSFVADEKPTSVSARTGVLPRIDSEKTLTHNDDEGGKGHDEAAVSQDGVPEDIPALSRTRKILLGFVMMMEVLVSVSTRVSIADHSP